MKQHGSALHSSAAAMFIQEAMLGEVGVIVPYGSTVYHTICNKVEIVHLGIEYIND